MPVPDLIRSPWTSGGAMKLLIAQFRPTSLVQFLDLGTHSNCNLHGTSSWKITTFGLLGYSQERRKNPRSFLSSPLVPLSLGHKGYGGSNPQKVLFSNENMKSTIK